MIADRCVYFHLTPGENRVFYIGIGSIKRAKEFNASRNKHWKKIVAEHGKPTVLILAKNLTIDEAVRWEKFWIKHHGLDRLANISPGGDSVIGFTVPEEIRQQISKTLKGRKLSKEHIENVANALRGKKRNSETVKKIALINTGKKRSNEAKQNMRNGQLGKTRSEDHKRKISEAMKGIKYPNRSKKIKNQP